MSDDEAKKYATGGPIPMPLNDGDTRVPLGRCHYWIPWVACWGLELAHEEALLENAAREYDKTLAAVKAITDAAREALDRIDVATKHFAFSPVPVKPAPGSVFEKNAIKFRDNPDCPTFAVWRPDRDRSAFIDYVPPGGAS